MSDASYVLPFRGADDRARNAPRVAEHLHANGLIAYPTETVYGFGCALRPEALARLASLKERSRPFLILIEDPDQLPDLVWTDAARALAARFWPGPLTLALRAEPGRYPEAVVAPDGTVAVRASPHPAVRSILGCLGEPITSTSANRPGRQPAASADEVRGVLRELGNPPYVWVLDGGELPPSLPSTIIDCTGDVPRIVRAGAIGRREIENVVKVTDGHG
ncbi:MAG TPA: L-threonylcarbamoyladenylate synthase [Longimicrobiales bacterium]|nr:L-threonylcarbamoyladenylate synthase [Longimicrobiales bacterium]